MPKLNWHARQRSAQRNVSAAEVQYVIDHGQRFHKAGALIYFLRRCDVPEDDLNDDERTRLMGTAVILTKDGRRVITIWRNRRDGLKHIKHKPKYSTGPKGNELCWL